MSSFFSAVSLLGLCLLLSRLAVSKNSSDYDYLKDEGERRNIPCYEIETGHAEECAMFQWFGQIISAYGICEENDNKRSFKFNQFF